MADRKYTPDEIVRMREAIFQCIFWSVVKHINRYDCASRIEDQLRTYMMNGTSPEELEELAASFKKASDDYYSRMLPVRPFARPPA